MSDVFDAPERRDRREAREERDLAERTRAGALMVGLDEPPLSQSVLHLLAAADGARFQAHEAYRRADKAMHRGRAAVLEHRAGQQRASDLDAHWRRLTMAEVIDQAAKRGEEMENVLTEVPLGLTSEDGVRMLEADGTPMFHIDRQIALSRKTGLKWLFDKGRLQHWHVAVGNAFGDICCRAAQAAEPGRVDEGGSGGRASKASPGPAGWRLEAMADLRVASDLIRKSLPPEEGNQMLLLVAAVCHQGMTVRDLAKGNNHETVRLEERLRTGLAMLRVGYDAGVAKAGASPFVEQKGSKFDNRPKT